MRILDFTYFILMFVGNSNKNCRGDFGFIYVCFWEPQTSKNLTSYLTLFTSYVALVKKIHFTLSVICSHSVLKVFVRPRSV